MRRLWGRLARICRRLFSLLVYTQLASPMIAAMAILVSSALGINSSEGETQNFISNASFASVKPRSGKNGNGEGPGSVASVVPCCELPVYRQCPQNHAPRLESCTPNSRQSSQGQNSSKSSLEAVPFLCSQLSLDCLNCTCDYDCQYGSISQANCTVYPGVECEGEHSFVREFTCSYCYLSRSGTTCSRGLAANCRSTSPASQRSHWYVANCSTNSDVICLGSSVFSKRLECSWTEGYSWKTALALSVTLGGFGADRFYLGHWQEGIGKLFSFGGLGVWTLVDVVLVAVRYIGPADGSLYI